MSDLQKNLIITYELPPQSDEGHGRDVLLNYIFL